MDGFYKVKSRPKSVLTRVGFSCVGFPSEEEETGRPPAAVACPPLSLWSHHRREGEKDKGKIEAWRRRQERNCDAYVNASDDRKVI